MEQVKSDSAQAEGYGVLIVIAIIIFLLIIVIMNWDTIYQAYLQIKTTTCVNDSGSPWNNC